MKTRLYIAVSDDLRGESEERRLREFMMATNMTRGVEVLCTWVYTYIAVGLRSRDPE